MILHCLCITSNIQTHAVIVGIAYVLKTAYCIFTIVDQDEVEHMPGVDPQFYTFLKYYMLTITILMILMTILYWIGFLKRKRWCLTVNIIFMAGGFLPKEILEIIRTFNSEGIEEAAGEIAYLIIGMYIVSVIHHMRADFLTDELEDQLLDEQHDKHIIENA